MKNRIIKFRAWNVSKKIMSYEVGLLPKSPYAWGASVNIGGMFFNQNLITDNDVLMQFAGLHDRNGKEIWEGDIVEFYMTSPWDSEVPVLVKSEVFMEGGAWMINTPEGKGFLCYFLDVRVIGNIYENKNLLDHEAHSQ